MEKIHFTVDPRYLLRQMIYQIYKQNINQYKENEKLVCAISKLFIVDGEIHHIIPKEMGGNDNYDNLLYVDKNVHKLIHLKNNDKIQIYLKHFGKIVSNYADFIKRLNKYRLLAGNREINLNNN